MAIAGLSDHFSREPGVGVVDSALDIVVTWDDPLSVSPSGFSAGTDQGLWAVATYFIVQTVDGYLIVPYVARRTVDLAPATFDVFTPDPGAVAQVNLIRLGAVTHAYDENQRIVRLSFLAGADRVTVVPGLRLEWIPEAYGHDVVKNVTRSCGCRSCSHATCSSAGPACGGGPSGSPNRSCGDGRGAYHLP